MSFKPVIFNSSKWALETRNWGHTFKSRLNNLSVLGLKSKRWISSASKKSLFNTWKWRKY